MFVGVGSRRVRSLFAAAKKKAPCIVFIDEIDAIGGSRKQWENHTRKTLNQLLTEMDGFEANEGVIVMAATNLQVCEASLLFAALYCAVLCCAAVHFSVLCCAAVLCCGCTCQCCVGRDHAVLSDAMLWLSFSHSMVWHGV